MAQSCGKRLWRWCAVRVVIPFKRHFELNDKVGGFSIRFDPGKNDLDKLIEFVRTFPDKQIEVTCRNGVDVKSASALSKVADNVRFCIGAVDLRKCPQLRERGCRFFFDRSVSADSWSELSWLVEDMGVSDVYVCDDLMYELDRVHHYCLSHGTLVRLVANRVAASHVVDPKSDIAPLVLPQDMGTIGRWVDVIEFDCGEPFDFKRLKVLYHVYVTNRFWYGQLGEINPDADGLDIPCPCVSGRLCEKRSTCGLRCARGRACNTCSSLMASARGLRDIHGRII